MGRSRGGLTTKIHLCTDGEGKPIRFHLTQGQRNDCTQGPKLLRGLKCQYMLADKGYDSQQVLNAVKKTGGEAVIPPRKHRKYQRPYDRKRYKLRNAIERTFGFFKQFRRIATRYERKTSNYSSLIALAATTMWIQ